jgi:uncharacterized protein (TIGR03067 family)
MPLCLGLVVAMLGFSPSDAVKKELDIIQGQWTVKWIEQDGKKFELDERVCVFRGNKCTWHKGAPQESKGEQATFEIDPTCAPKIIDYTAPAVNGTKKEGIYKIEGDTMVWCLYEGEGAKNRPSEFKTTPGSDCVMIWFTRSKTTEKKN